MKPMDKLAAAIREADRRRFVKSMTTHIDHRLWQGVCTTQRLRPEQLT